MKDLCAGAIQMVSGDSVPQNLERAYALLREAAERGAQLILLPENFAHLSDSGSFSVAEPFAQSGDVCATVTPIQNALQQWARELGLWILSGAVPLLERVDGSPTDGKRSRSACLLYDDSGTLRARYDKMHLFDVEVEDAAGSYRESRSIEPGETPCVATTPWGQLGLSICFDLRFPELYRQLAAAGAEILVVPAAFTHTTGQAHWLTLLKARAIENGCYVIAANQGGQHSAKRRTWGHSVIIDPWGDVLAEAGEGEAVITATLSAEKLEKVRRNMPLLSMRRL
ncbi:carbon-nitrogen hydrolase family protein [Microbulbifer sp. CAU 1566]|uniref:carbon-nitrogen hydrolase family protein n=1 Tax=Microbulbifer sp. CAU 1566 TaxID=2933269 RepID=UPI00200503D2|nr:carbon-nitrogen hydrolase family protein [Microbulbifer sp. CAU 1566]MCK7598159.1 carbon-nitrogen hydrolase family protein [Microbulbifer sp. CAU 1566]